MNVRLRAYESGDRSRYLAWLTRRHVAPWYAPAEAWLAEIDQRDGVYSFIRHFIILADETPIGACQHYPYWQSGEDWHGAVSPEGSYSIDYLIGEVSYLRRGVGAQAVRLLAEDVFEKPDARRIIVQPDAENEASRRTLLAAGFALDPSNGLFILRRPRAGQSPSQ